MMITEMLGKSSSFSSSSKRRGFAVVFQICLGLLVFLSRSDPPQGEREREREREQENREGRRTGKEPSLSFSTSPLPLHAPTPPLSAYLYFSIIFSPSISPLSFRLYLYDILARRFISHLVFSLLSPLGFPLSLFSSSSCFFFCLEKMMKKKIRFSMDQAPSTSFMAGEEASARFKYQCLLQDYLELLKETKEKRERLKRAMQSKLKLLAEVKFLRKKYHTLSNTTQAFPCKVKKQSYKNVSPSKQVSPPHCPVIETELPLKERNNKSVEVSLRSGPRLIDLNQVSLPNGEEMDAFEMDWEPLKMDDDLKFSVCRDIGRSSSQGGKRKISWQDQLALRV